MINGKKTKIGESIFRVHPISDPYARYVGQTGGKISKEIVKVNNGLWQFHIAELECQPYFKVDKYSVIIVKSDKTVLMTENKGGKFEDATVDIIDKLDKGDLLIFSQSSLRHLTKLREALSQLNSLSNNSAQQQPTRVLQKLGRRNWPINSRNSNPASVIWL